MKISKFTVGILISMILLSIFFGYVLNVLNTGAVSSSGNNKENFIKIGDSSNNLIWILQISDIHISIFRDPLRITQFKEFCHQTIDAIQPSVVLASGDLTDAKTKDSIGSEQYEEEWKYYRNVLRETRAYEKTLWLDIRGNHDNFNVADQYSKQNFFTNYSVQGKEHPRSYMYQIKRGSSFYSFIGIDACLEPGPRRPFNFIGMLDQVEVDEINDLIKKTEDANSNFTVFFGHFPTSCILTEGSRDIREIIGNHKEGLVYVCGHLHKLGGIIPNMYTLQRAGFLELELGDWKDNRVYRLLAIDHGLLSFNDIQHGDWPAILVTNPKHALFFNPARENLDSLKDSTHIRILAFSLSSIEQVKVRLDDGDWMICKNVKGPLYVARWDPQNYLKGIHYIEVSVRDSMGRVKTERQPFSLDGSRLSFGFLSKVALMSNASLVFRTMFFLMLCLSVLPLCLLRYVHFLVIKGKLIKPRPRRGCCFNWMRKIWVMTTIDKLFWPIVLYPIYLAVGPWSVGYLVEDHIGAIFAWGIYVNGAFLPGAFTYLYGFIQLVTFQFPVTFIIAGAVDRRFNELIVKKGRKLPLQQRLWSHLPFIIIFVMQTIMAYLFWLAYGTLAFFLGPLRTWSIFLAIILYYQAHCLTENNIRKAADIWYSQPSDVALTGSKHNNDDIDFSSQVEKLN